MARVFLSYSSKDKPFILRLAQDLKQAGVEVWLDEWEINVGDDIRQKIEHGISNYEYFAIALSVTSVSSPWVQRELSAAVVKEMETRKIIILPLKIQECVIPPLIAGKRYADFSTDYQYGLQDLLKVLRVVQLKHWSFEGFELSTARRGLSEPPQRIAMANLISSQSTLLALVESIGDPELAIEATGACIEMLKVLYGFVVDKSEELEPQFLVTHFFKVADLAVKEVRANALSTTTRSAVGTKMALMLRVGSKVYTSKVGDCGGVVHWKKDLDEGERAYRRIDPPYTATFSYTAHDLSSIALTAPLGLLSSETEFEAGIIESELDQIGDFIALTSFDIPKDDDVLQKTVESLSILNDSNSIAKYLCENQHRSYGDCMSAVVVLT